MTFIATIDLETTGLDPKTDAIIEIGAVRFNYENGRKDKEWSTLINPKRPIPPNITRLTHISNEMVHGKPTLQDVLHEFVDFIGDDVVLGHNVIFDLSFLRQHKVLIDNDYLDTYELASVLLPSASRYNLTALCQINGIFTAGESHRALDDSRNTYALFLFLKEKALELPIEIIAELLRLSEPFDWGGSWLFRELMRNKWQQPVKPRVDRNEDGLPFGVTKFNLLPPLQPTENNVPIDPDEIASMLEHGGLFSQHFNNFEYRPQQVEMLRAIAHALSEKQHLMVEAGTGTGKSFAYLVPAAVWALQNNQRIIISTNTINLQDQLINKDIPDLRAVLHSDLKAVVIKGRSNYLCPRRLEALRQRTPENADEMRVLGKVLVWLLEGGSGDRGEINLNGPVERDYWMRLSAENEGCKGEVCLARMGGLCPFYRVRQASQSAHLLVVNHALLLADIASGNRVLPDYDYLIVDEAHHMELATTNALSFEITEGDMVRIFRELGGTASGVLGYLLNLLKAGVQPSEYSGYHQKISRITDLAFRLEHDIKNFFIEINQFLEEQRDGHPVGTYSQQVRITSATRSQPSWGNIEISWETSNETMQLLINLIIQLHRSISDMSEKISEDLDDAISNLGNILRRLNEAQSQLNAWVSQPNNENIYWAEIHPLNMRITLHVAPLHIGALMEQYLWHEKNSIILTSATLTTNFDFDYIRNQLNADEADELVVGSPFDYENSAMLYLANDIPEPINISAYQRAVEQTILRLGKATGGRMLVLFTSYAQLKQTSQVITPHLLEADIQVYEQGDGASANTLLETFRASERAVLLGTRSFWEGVDIPGEKLSVLVIVKIPFDVPSDPIVAARSETFDDPFNEYSLPEAILRFRQGFGRLIRTETDRGVVAVLDRRILSKRYGKFFIESLPTCEVKVGSMLDLPNTAIRWLNL